MEIYHGITALQHFINPTNDIAERAVRRVKKGTPVVMLRSGLDERWWSASVECWCYLGNVQDFLAVRKTLFERRFGEPFKGPITPVGAMVEYHPISVRDQSRIHQCGKKVLLDIFLGCELTAGGIWKGDILTADLEDLEKFDASNIYPRRINAKEVLIRQKAEEPAKRNCSAARLVRTLEAPRHFPRADHSRC